MLAVTILNSTVKYRSFWSKNMRHKFTYSKSCRHQKCLTKIQKRWGFGGHFLRHVLFCIYSMHVIYWQVKVKVQAYILISNIASDFYIFTPCSLSLFIRVRSQLHGEHTVLQPSRRIKLIIHIAISVLPGTHFTSIEWSFWGLCVLLKDTTSKQCPNIEMKETWYFSENPAPSGIRKRMAGSDIDKAPRSSHCTMSLSTELLKWRYFSSFLFS